MIIPLIGPKPRTGDFGCGNLQFDFYNCYLSAGSHCEHAKFVNGGEWMCQGTACPYYEPK